MTVQTWVDLAPAVEPVRAALSTAIGKVVTFARAPKGDTPPFSVLTIVGDPRTILTLDGGVPADVTWQVDHIALTMVQALAMGDRAARAMVLDDPATWDQAFVVAREAVGDGRPQMISEGRFSWQQQFRWTLVGTS